MDSQEFVRIRRYLGKTQTQLAHLLGVSPKAVQSFEQAWRNIPPHAERQLLFLLYLKRLPEANRRPCWEEKDCGQEQREHCAAWEFRAGNLCWFTNGTVCTGTAQPTWHQKMRLCRQCEVFLALVPPVS